MATKKYKPITPGTRKKSTLLFKEVTKNVPNKALTKFLKKSSGRNNQGRITVRHKGGGVKRKYRCIDFKRDTIVQGKVASIEYDPNRSALIALVKHVNGDQRYIVAPKGIKVGDVIQNGEGADINIGNVLPLSSIPVGSHIYNVELTPGKGAQLVRSAGAFAVLMAKLGYYATVKLPSGEVRLINLKCKAAYGRASNEAHNNARRGKAGITRKLDIRPTVRGAAMNPADHTHGGGEGRAPVGRSEPRTAYGKKANVNTRRKRKSQRHLVRSRKR